MNEQDGSPVLVGREGSVGVITLNRPDRLNAWTTEMENRYFDALQGFGDDTQIKAIVVTGAGRAFCAGADMDNLDAHATDGPQGVLGRRPQTYPLGIGKPIIAAINGPCAGIGLVQALMCDLRFAASGAKLTTSFAKIGLIAEHGISWLLPRHVGIGNALDLLLSSRVVMSEEALRMGLVSRVCSPESLFAEAMAHAESLAQSVAPSAMAIIKRQIYADLTCDLEPALERANAHMFETLEGDDFKEGVRAFAEKRPPNFPGVRV